MELTWRIDAGARARLKVLTGTHLALAATGGAVVLLGVRLVHDLGVKAYYEDEAVGGLVSARPLGELIRTVVWDRGGAPLHFLLAHFAFAIDPTAVSLRWLSVLCALATVAVAYALGRQLAGDVAGVTAAWVVAASSLLRVYGTFGRMYSLLALLGGLNMLLFLRALERPTRRRVVLAAASAWLLAATHPFAAVPVVAEAAVALWLWRGRGWARAVPCFIAAAATLPLFVADIRLAGRFDVSATSGTAIGSGGAARAQLDSAVRGFAGGHGPTFWLLGAFALVGVWAIVRRSPFFALVGASALLVPPVLSLVAHVQNTETAYLTSRHLIAALPLWAVLVGAGTAHLVRASRGGRPLATAAVCAAAALAVVSPATARDPRTLSPFWASTGSLHQSAVVGAWLNARIRPDDLLFPYAVPYLRALPAAQKARSLPRGDAPTLLATIGNDSNPQEIWVTLPIGPNDSLRSGALRSLKHSYPVKVFARWLVVRVPGPFHSRRAIVAALARSVDAASSAVKAVGQESDAYERITRHTVDVANQSLR